MTASVMLALETSGPVTGFSIARLDRLTGVRVPHSTTDFTLPSDGRRTALLFEAIRNETCQMGCEIGDVAIFCFSRGPGSFTGLRIAATIGSMLQSVLGCRVVAVPTFQALALAAQNGAENANRIAVIGRARAERVFAATFEISANGDLEEVVPLEETHFSTWLAKQPPETLVTGPGLIEHGNAVREQGLTIAPPDIWEPRSAFVLEAGIREAAQGRFADPHEITPLYIRPPECEEVFEQRRAAARAKRIKTTP